ncbi:MAG TPA: 4Fe-4S dicluster domain-containing protein [Lachnospiraceae bacterium]|nr:4Fe-4S dicluster domain-containing protein [Lachnospiraceae bacterium]
MLHENATLVDVKHEVLLKVAKAAFDGELDQAELRIPYEIIPGPNPTFRCCVYKEREVIRERISLAKNREPLTGAPCHNTVQIIPAACEGCPITRYVVTDNCQKCMVKKCQESCNFGAITMFRDKAHIDPQKCRECGKCHTACPYNAIADLMRPCKKSCPVDAIGMDENMHVRIDDEKCIRCGACIKDCPFGAISDSSRMVEVIEYLLSEQSVYAMVAPAGEGTFGEDISMESLRNGLKEIGFKGMFEVALGADYVAHEESLEWDEVHKEGRKMTTSCCPAFVHMINRHFPELKDCVSTTISPMAATARMIRAMDENAVCIFIGPCIAKKSEAGQAQHLHGESADLVLTFEELRAMLQARDITLKPTEYKCQQGSIYGKNFAKSGGVSKAITEAMKENGSKEEFRILSCNGAAECKKALLMLRAGKLPEDFIEGMICTGGCVNGPGVVKPQAQTAASRVKALSEADARTIEGSMAEQNNLVFSMHKSE